MATYLDTRSLDWALEHCSSKCYNFFPIPFEYHAIRRDWSQIRAFLESEDVEAWKTNPPRRVVAPKEKYGCRIVTELNPLDHLVYASLVYEIGEDIEQSRIEKDRDIVISSRFLPSADGNYCDLSYGYRKFSETCKTIAESGDYGFVVVTDIADFFPRLYEHRLENALSKATSKTGHIRAIINLIKNWNEKVSSGIPVGPFVSRLLAEAAIVDIDNLLNIKGIKFCRWYDDFRIFVEDFKEGYQVLTFLAQKLYENHNFTLQSSKTYVMPIDRFIDEFIFPEQRREIARIDEKISEIIFSEYNDDYENHPFNPYHPPNEDIEISDDVYDEIESLNLVEILEEEVDKSVPNYKLIKYILNRFIERQDGGLIEYLLTSIDKLFPVFFEIVKYIQRTDIENSRKERVGELLYHIYDNSILSSCRFSRMWIANCFSNDPDMASSTMLYNMFESGDDNVKREVFIAMSKKDECGWIRGYKTSWGCLSPWVKNSFLSSTDCLPDDEKRAFHRSIRSRLSPLEKSIIL